MKKEIIVEYSSNNSGGSWWLRDKDWRALKKHGWTVIWSWEEYVYEGGSYIPGKDGFPVVQQKAEKNTRWLGAIAKYAYKKFGSIKEALEEFEKITGQDVTEEGCGCCGAPHSFNWSASGCITGGCKCEKGHKDYNYASGEDLLEYLTGIDGNLSKRDLIKKLSLG